MIQYTDLLQDILDNDVVRDDRTGTGTKSVFGRMLRFDLNAGFPLLTLRKIFFDKVVDELLWFISGSTNINDLGVGRKFWEEFDTDGTGELGPIYSAQWRNWTAHGHSTVVGDFAWHIDQLTEVIGSIKANPNSRRHLVSAWNVGQLHKMRLPPCHYAFQFSVANGKLSCMVNMRSSDVFIGLPANIASYALLTHMIAQICGLGVGELVMSLADTHLYLNHIDAAKEVIRREKDVFFNSSFGSTDPSYHHYWHDGTKAIMRGPFTPPETEQQSEINSKIESIQLYQKASTLPTLTLNPDITDIDSFTAADIHLHNYNPLPHIPVKLAV